MERKITKVFVIGHIERESGQWYVYKRVVLCLSRVSCKGLGVYTVRKILRPSRVSRRDSACIK